MMAPWALLLLLVLCGSAACRSTHSVTTANSVPGETGFGVERHNLFIFMLIAAASVNTYATGVAAHSSPQGGGVGEGVWQVHAGGLALRYCRGDVQSACANAVIDQRRPGKRVLVLVDTANRGQVYQQSTVTAADPATGGTTTTTFARGSVLLHNRMVPTTPYHGVWLTDEARLELFHCQVEAEGPRCRMAVHEAGGLGMMSVNILSMQVVRRAGGLDDVIWFATQPRGNIYRCQSNAQQLDPACQHVPVQGQ